MSHKQQLRYVEMKETRARNEVVYFVCNGRTTKLHAPYRECQREYAR